LFLKFVFYLSYCVAMATFGWSVGGCISACILIKYVHISPKARFQRSYKRLEALDIVGTVGTAFQVFSAVLRDYLPLRALSYSFHELETR
jgi:hypothetical protein